MDLLNLLVKAGGQNSIGQLAGTIGLGESETTGVVGALAPAFARGLQQQATSPAALTGLQNALTSGDHRQYIEQPELMKADASREDGNRILGHLFGSKEESRSVAADAAQQTGIDASVIEKALPLIAGLAMGALSKEAGSGDSAGVFSGGALSGLLGGLAGGDNNEQGGLGGALDIAKKLF